MTLHHSTRFKGGSISYHGTVEIPIQITDDFDHIPILEKMIAVCRLNLNRKIKEWREDPTQIIKTEFYYYKGSEEIVFFRWKKEEEKI